MNKFTALFSYSGLTLFEADRGVLVSSDQLLFIRNACISDYFNPLFLVLDDYPKKIILGGGN